MRFNSIASNLVAGDKNSAADVFIRDLQNGTTERVSVSTQGKQGNGFSSLPAIAPSGRAVAFDFDATNLVPGDTNGATDVFVRNVPLGTTILVSVGLGGVAGNAGSSLRAISANGVVTFLSQASNLVPGDTNGVSDVFARDLSHNSTTERVSVGPGGTQCNRNSFGGAVSPDGQLVAFHSTCTNLVPGGTNGRMQVISR